MIGNRSRLGTGFTGLQQYLLHGRNGASPDRAVWTATRNLPGDEPEQAAAIMRATANHSLRVERPVYHLSVSLAPEEHLDRSQLEAVADRLLADLGLEQHQTLVVEHVDAKQQHIHLMVNRVHPDTGRAWNDWRDHQRIETSLRAQERELGLRVVRGRLAQDRERLFVGPRNSREPFAGRVRELVHEPIRTASNWQEVHASLKGQGLEIQPSRSSRGLVITDGRRFVAASQIDRKASGPALEQRLGPYEAPSPDLDRLRDITDRLEKHRRLDTVRGKYVEKVQELGRRLEWQSMMKSYVERTSADMDRQIGWTYRDPAVARHAIDQSLRRDGLRTTDDTLGKKPQTFGKLLGRWRSPERESARLRAQRSLSGALCEYSKALDSRANAFRRLERYRQDPRQPVLEGAERVRQRLRRTFRRFEKLEKLYGVEKELKKQGVAIAKRLGWKAVGRLLPSPGVQMLRAAVSLTRPLSRGLDQGRGIEL